MARDTQRVNYHVVSVMYLEQGREIGGPDLARLWFSLDLFGKHQGLCSFWHAGTHAADPQPIELGSMELVQPLLGRGKMPIYGGGACVEARTRKTTTLDYDLYYTHEAASRCFDYVTLPYLMYAVSGRWFEMIGADAVIENIRLHMDVIDQYAPPYGLIDVSASEDCYAGMAYAPYFFLNCHTHRWVEHMKWLHACSERRDQVRGVYWGNYFGRAILNRLGGRQAFIQRFQRQTTDQDGLPTARLWEFPNGVFMSLCNDPMGCRPGLPLDGAAGRNLQWLVRELLSQGLL